MTISPVRLNHAVLFVADLDRAAVVERLDLTQEFNRWSGIRTAGDLVTDTTAEMEPLP